MCLRHSLIAMALVVTSQLQAAPLWQVLNAPGPGAASVQLPAIAVDAQPVSVAVDVMTALQVGSELSLRFSPADELVYVVQQLQRFENGDLGLRAELNDAVGNYIISLTVGAEDLLATIYVPQGKLRLQARRSAVSYDGYLFRESDQIKLLPRDLEIPLRADQRDALSSADAAPGSNSANMLADTLTDSDGDGISDFNEALLGTNPNNASSGPAQGANVVIDLLMMYTPKYVSDSPTKNAVLELNQLIQETNDMYASSGVGLSFRPSYRLVNYTVNPGLEQALDAMADKTGVFADIEFQRAVRGADLVVLMDGLNTGPDEVCGIAFGGGDNSLGDFTDPGVQTIYSANYSAGAAGGQGSGCDNLTVAHEIGHVMGLGHSRVEQRTGAGGSTFPWALGHGVKDSFHTIMAYADHFPNSDQLPQFSNPSRNTCKAQTCGVLRSNTTDGADAVLALNTVRFQIARYFAERPLLALANASGASTNATARGGVIRTGGPRGMAKTFATNHLASDQVSLVTSLSVDSAHVGQMGVTHIVIAAAGIGNFQVNSSGGYVPWNGDPATLLGSIAPRPLQAIEELTAFSGLSFASIGIPAVSLTVFFAYAVQSTGALIYTSAGVPLVIQ